MSDELDDRSLNHTNSSKDSDTLSIRSHRDAATEKMLQLRDHMDAEAQKVLLRRESLQSPVSSGPSLPSPTSVTTTPTKRHLKVFGFPHTTHANKCRLGTSLIKTTSTTVSVPHALGDDSSLVVELDGVWDSPLVDCQHMYEKTTRPLVQAAFRGYNCTSILFESPCGTMNLPNFAFPSPSVDVHDNNICNGVLQRALALFLTRSQGVVVDDSRSSTSNVIVVASAFVVSSGFIVDALDDTKQPTVGFNSDGHARVNDVTETELASPTSLAKVLEKLRCAITDTRAEQDEAHGFITLQGKRKSTSSSGKVKAVTGTLTFAWLGQPTPSDLLPHTTINSEGVRDSMYSDSESEGEDGGDSGARTDLELLVSIVFHLTSKKEGQAPYRSSMLTSILRSALGGNSKTSIFLTVPEEPASLSLARQLLQFAAAARHIKNKATPSKTFLAQQSLLHSYQRQLGMEEDESTTPIRHADDDSDDDDDDDDASLHSNENKKRNHGSSRSSSNSNFNNTMTLSPPPPPSSTSPTTSGSIRREFSPPIENSPSDKHATNHNERLHSSLSDMFPSPPPTFHRSDVKGVRATSPDENDTTDTTDTTDNNDTDENGDTQELASKLSAHHSSSPNMTANPFATTIIATATPPAVRRREQLDFFRQRTMVHITTDDNEGDSTKSKARATRNEALSAAKIAEKAAEEAAARAKKARAMMQEPSIQSQPVNALFSLNAAGDRGASDGMMEGGGYGYGPSGGQHGNNSSAAYIGISQRGLDGGDYVEAMSEETQQYIAALVNQNEDLRTMIVAQKNLDGLDWNEIMTAMKKPITGVTVMHQAAYQRTHPDLIDFRVFTGEDAFHWIAENVTTRQEALEPTTVLTACSSLLTMGAIVPVTEEGANEFSADVSAWYTFDETWTSAVQIAQRDGERKYHPRRVVISEDWVLADIIAYNQNETTQELLEETIKHPLLYDIISPESSQKEIKALIATWGPQVVDSKGRSALHYAVIMNAPRTCRVLIKSGANVNARDNCGASPLLYAAFKGHVEAMTVLLKMGAENHPDNHGQTAIHWAVRHFDTDILRQLLTQRQISSYDVNRQERNNQISALHMAISVAAVKHVVILLEFGADPLVMDVYGKSCLDYCIHYSCPEALVCILNVLPEVINHRNSSGRSALLMACGGGGCVKCARILFSSKTLALDAADLSLTTPLHQCAKYNRINTAKYLLDKGAHVDPTDTDDKTPRDYAEAFGHFEMVQILDEAKELATRRVMRRGSVQSVMSGGDGGRSSTVATLQDGVGGDLSPSPTHQRPRRSSSLSEQQPSSSSQHDVSSKRKLHRSIPDVIVATTPNQAKNGCSPTRRIMSSSSINVPQSSTSPRKKKSSSSSLPSLSQPPSPSPRKSLSPRKPSSSQLPPIGENRKSRQRHSEDNTTSKVGCAIS